MAVVALSGVSASIHTVPALCALAGDGNDIEVKSAASAANGMALQSLEHIETGANFMVLAFLR